MIISAYPTIGKTTLAKKRKDIIDLESSCFDKNNPNWYVDYCKTAIDLESQGYTVFVSSHKPVQEYLITNHNSNYVMLFYSPILKDYVIKKATERYNCSEKKDKDLRALERIQNHFEEDIKAIIMTEGLNQYQIVSKNYVLEEIVDSLSKGEIK